MRPGGFKIRCLGESVKRLKKVASTKKGYEASVLASTLQNTGEIPPPRIRKIVYFHGCGYFRFFRSGTFSRFGKNEYRLVEFGG